MAPKKVKAPVTGCNGADAPDVFHNPAIDIREIPPTTTDLQVQYVRRRARVAPSLVPTVTALAFGDAR